MKWRIALALVALLLLAQVVPLSRDNPPREGEVAAPPEVRAILERSCYDCHSRDTRWPWYAYVAPVSWLLVRDVHEGREFLDFTAWDTYSETKRRKLLHETWEEVEEGEMPPWMYLPMHPEARLSDADREQLRNWTRVAAPAAPGDAGAGSGAGDASGDLAPR